MASVLIWKVDHDILKIKSFWQLRYSFPGLLLQVAEEFFGITLTLKELPSEPSGKDECNQFRFRVNFDNRDYLANQEAIKGSSLEPEKKLLKSDQPCIRKMLANLPSTILLKLFPFALVFRRDLKLIAIGRQLKVMFPEAGLVGQALPDLAKMRRPKIYLDWDNVGKCTVF